jgi:hypothetical protein
MPVQGQQTILIPSSPCRREEVTDIYNTPLLDLVYKAASVHRMYNDPQMVGGGGCWRPTAMLHPSSQQQQWQRRWCSAMQQLPS